MTKEQIEQLEEFAFELRNNRDYYSRAKIIEMMVDEVKKLNKHAVSGSLPLPEFLYNNGLGCVLTGVHGDTNVTDEWNEWLKTNIGNDR